MLATRVDDKDVYIYDKDGNCDKTFEELYNEEVHTDDEYEEMADDEDDLFAELEHLKSDAQMTYEAPPPIHITEKTARVKKLKEIKLKDVIVENNSPYILVPERISRIHCTMCYKTMTYKIIDIGQKIRVRMSCKTNQ